VRKKVLLHDINTHVTSLISVTPTGAEIDGDSQLPDISGDGNSVIFGSTASNVVADDTNSKIDVFVRDIPSSSTKLVSLDRSGNQFTEFGAGGSTSVSNDGRFTTFSSTLTAIGSVIFLRDTLPVDTVLPLVLGAADRSPDFGDWYNNDVTIHWTATDPAPSSGTPTDPPDTYANQEGTHTYTSDPSCDPAGNCATDSLTLKIDKTAPVLSAPSWTASPKLPNESSTLAVPVTDAHSGVASGEYFIGADPGQGFGATMTLTNGNLITNFSTDLPVGEYSIGVRAQDNAGNWSPVITTTLIVVDNTPPDVTYTLSGNAPNTVGWYSQPVTVKWSFNDPESAITNIFGCDTITINSGTTDITPSCTVTSAGGTTTQLATIHYDATAPTMGAPTWSTNPVTVGNNTSFSVPATDTTSGITGGEYFVGTDPGVGNASPLAWDGTNLNSTAFGPNLAPGVYNIGIRSQDAAGNWSAALTSYLVVFDPAGPGYIVGQHNVTPGSGDVLPWISTKPGDFATFGFNMKFTPTGTADSSSKFGFRYVEKGNCGKSNTPACHSFILTSTAFDWFALSGTNSSQGVFQGTATLTIDGSSSTVSYTVQAVDGDRLAPTQQDSFVMKVYPLDSDAQTTIPLYQVAADFTPGTGNANGGIQIKH
jgi:hypothetical protein